MALSRQHFAASNHQTLHCFRQEHDNAALEEHVRSIAKSCRYRFSLLDGKDIRDGSALEGQIATLYEFPGENEGKIIRHNWDATNDWLGDLTWLTGWPPGSSRVKGFILFYRHPAALFNADTGEFGRLLQIVDAACTEHEQRNIAMHMIGAPINNRMEAFLTMSKFYPRICKECLYGSEPSENTP